ncbi:Putative Ras GTPase-activating protein FLJ00412-like protein [Anas platyrhynchos]|uniref:Putative Ras GTPase-activating protein FLJ00412-like protein n=1 Tax=Anas platyrhynchos TaxID=8839 RepID=R0JHI2_ANAPL|nr:Putative Ras GTPase-activating protein FLJ00412-like protein [Anas platyrhynchos]
MRRPRPLRQPEQPAAGCEETFQRIATSCEAFPAELGEIFAAWQEECAARGKAAIGQRLVSASLFLRFLCPAIMSPSLFGLMQEYPDEQTARTLTLIAKVIQNLANFTTFGEKEAYMGFMNEFLEHHWGPMTTFLQSVANPESSVHMATYDGYVDLALELATLHLLLCDIFSSLDQATQEELEPLPTILNAIREGTPVPVSVRLSSTTERRFFGQSLAADPPQPRCGVFSRAPQSDRRGMEKAAPALSEHQGDGGRALLMTLEPNKENFAALECPQEDPNFFSTLARKEPDIALEARDVAGSSGGLQTLPCAQQLTPSVPKEGLKEKQLCSNDPFWKSDRPLGQAGAGFAPSPRPSPSRMSSCCGTGPRSSSSSLRCRGENQIPARSTTSSCQQDLGELLLCGDVEPSSCFPSSASGSSPSEPR